MTGPIALTAKQEKLWRFIASCERSPSYVEMRDQLGFRGYAGIQRALDRIEELGLIKRTKHRKRGIEMVRWPDGRRVTKFRSLSDWTDAQLLAEIERRQFERADSEGGSRNWMTDARLGTTKLLKALETAGLRP